MLWDFRPPQWSVLPLRVLAQQTLKIHFIDGEAENIIRTICYTFGSFFTMDNFALLLMVDIGLKGVQSSRKL